MSVARSALALALFAAGLLACGARSELDGGRGGAGGSGPSSSSASTTASSSSVASSSSASSSSASSSSSSASSSSSSGPPCTTDAACDDGIDCTSDACTPGGCVHTPVDAACDDGVFCTRDRCDPAHGCRHPHDDTLCDDGIDCTIDTCVTATDACRHDACDNRCDDGVFCNGVERCDTAIGCVAGPPACRIPGCGPGTCHENGQTCTVMPSCAPGPTLVVTDSTGALVSVALDGQHSVIAPSHGDVHFDIAIVDGRWFAIDPTPALVELKPNTNHVKNSWPAPDANSLGAGPDGMLYAANSHVFRIDPDSGAFSQIASLPPGYSSSGDIAFLGSRMFVSADGPCGGALVEVLPDGTSQVIGGDGLGCVYGLASTGSTLYVMNCDGKLGTFDPDTGEARVISTPNLSVYGADILP